MTKAYEATAGGKRGAGAPGEPGGPETAAPAMGQAAPDHPSGRRLALDVHARLRSLILTGELTPGSVLLQAEMARRLGVSRTPMREAFRLLQEEGLIEARPDQRARVRNVDPEDLDSVYGARISLETLAVSVTIRTIGDGDVQRLAAALDRMRAHAAQDDIESWYAAHREFHQIITRAVGPQLRRMIASLGEHCERYIRLAQLGQGGSGSWEHGHRDHEALLRAFGDRDHDTATAVIARHLARTALTVMADVAPEFDPVTTRTALRLSHADS